MEGQRACPEAWGAAALPEDAVEKKNCLTHPEEISPRDCDCQKVALPFDNGVSHWTAGAPVRLEDIDHVSGWAMACSCMDWALFTVSPRCQPGSLPLGDGRFTVGVSPRKLGEPFPWPLEIVDAEHELWLVLREWVEEPQDEALARLLEGLPAWGVALQRWEAVRVRCERWLRAAAERREELEACGLWMPDIGEPGCGPHRYEDARKVLRCCGLPATRGTAAYFLSKVEPGFDLEGVVGASRGLLVTSFGLIPREGSPIRECEMVTQVTAVMPWTTDALRRQANQVGLKHAAWWKKVFVGQLDHGDLRRLNSRRPDALTRLLTQYRAGTIVRAKLEEKVLEQVAREAGVEPNQLSPQEEQKARRRLNARIRRMFGKNPLR
jgi:hypothetical protein